MEELLSEGEKERVKFHASASFQNTSWKCENVWSQKNFTYVKLNKDYIVFSCNKGKLQIEIFPG